MNDSETAGRDIPADAPIPGLRSGPRGVFGRIPLTVVLPSAAAGATAGTVTTALDGSPWAALGIGVGISALGAARWRGSNIWRTLGSNVALRWRNRRANDIPPPAEPFDVPVPETAGTRCGMRWHDGTLLTMLRVDRTDVTPTLLRPAEIRAGASVPLAEVARCLSQFDIRLAAVDVVILGVRARGPRPAVECYERLLGPLPAAATQSMWLVLRFDPLDNAEAVGNRGGGADGVIRTALVATRRVAGRLAARGLRISLLTADELAAAEAELLHDTEPHRWAEEWRALRCEDLALSGYTVRPDRLDAGALAAVWTLPGVATVTRLRLTPVTGPDAGAGEVALTALVRHDCTGAQQRAAADARAELGLRPLTGRQRRVLLDGGPLRPADAACGPPAALAGFRVPAGGCGQVIGADGDGFGVAVPLFGPMVRQVEIVGTLRLAQLTILRSIAVGARVVVHSARPREWARLAAAIDAPEILSISAPGGDAQHAAAATMIVYDGITATGQVSEGTAVRVRSAAEPAAPGADVVLIQSADAPDELRIRTAGGELTVSVVALPDEYRYLGEPEAAEPVPQPA